MNALAHRSQGASVNSGSNYIGRFAPSPSGPLHFGSLVAAVGSYLQARTAGGHWLVRIEDIDRPRVKPGMDDLILRTLRDFGFEWDGVVEYQSQRLALYQEALSKLRSQGFVYSCSCSRAEIGAGDEQRYPGTCRKGPLRSDQSFAQRLVVAEGTVEFADALQGTVVQNIAQLSGDFVVFRRDGYFAYHLAVVVDDAEQGITEIVRGADLLESTPRQIFLQRALGVATPRYCHLPLALDASGAKLSKSAQSLEINMQRAPQLLWQVLSFLRQSPPEALRGAALSELWEWAHRNWNLEPLRLVKSDSAPPP